jgi:hypothetical protein
MLPEHAGYLLAPRMAESLTKSIDAEVYRKVMGVVNELRGGQIWVDAKRYAADPEAVLREVQLKVKDFLDDDKAFIEIIVTDVRGRNL